MRDQLIDIVNRLGGIISRSQALDAVARHVLDDAIRAGILVAAFPSIYVLADLIDDPAYRLRAAVQYTQGAASHLDGLATWDLQPPEPYYVRPADDLLHLTIDGRRPQIRHPQLAVHRRSGFGSDPSRVRYRGGLTVVTLEQAVIDSWPMLPPLEQRTPVIRALRERRTTAARLHRCLVLNPRAAGLAEMRELIDLVAGGCHSELEIYGHDAFLTHPLLRQARAQVRIQTSHGLVYLDRYFDEEMVDVEFDGAAYHASREQRERDLRRDEALAAMGIQTVRLTRNRLVHASAEAVASVARILEVRRAQLALQAR